MYSLPFHLSHRAATNHTVESLTETQLLAIEVAARATSIFSVLGSMFVIVTFLSFSFFRKSINRLVFFATWGNFIANIATLISRAGIPKTSQLTALCEVQGMMIQWFMMADSFWVFCMATNVFLVFFHSFDSRQLRRLEKWYISFAYGIPAIPAFAYVILDHSGHRIMGPATLWCWVRQDVEWMRISFFYAPIWVIVSATLIIYIITGVKIFKQHAILRSFDRQTELTSIKRVSMGSIQASEPHSPSSNNVFVTTQIEHHVHNDSLFRSPSSAGRSVASTLITRYPHDDSRANQPVRPSLAILSHQGYIDLENGDDEHGNYSVTAYHEHAAKNSIALPARPSTAQTSRIRQYDNKAAMAYFTVAFLMFVALFMVWVPSSVNRVWAFTHQTRPSFPLNFISATVLPLQGLWNSIIYIYTTQPEINKAWEIISSDLKDYKKSCWLKGDKQQPGPTPPTHQSRPSISKLGHYHQRPPNITTNKHDPQMNSVADSKPIPQTPPKSSGGRSRSGSNTSKKAFFPT